MKTYDDPPDTLALDTIGARFRGHYPGPCPWGCAYRGRRGKAWVGRTEFAHLVISQRCRECGGGWTECWETAGRPQPGWEMVAIAPGWPQEAIDAQAAYEALLFQPPPG